MKVSNKVSPKIAKLQSELAKEMREKSGLDPSQTKEKKNTKGSAELDISENAKMRQKQFNRIKELALKSSGENDAKVERLRSLIDRGLYKVDADKIADKMVDSHATDAMLEASE